MRTAPSLIRLAAVGSLLLAGVACGSDAEVATNTTAAPVVETVAPTDSSIVDTVAPDTTVVDTTAPAETAAPVDLPTIVVTTNVLGDIVSNAVGDLAEVEVIMPIGADPHDFAPSAREAESMENADLLVINGADFEEGMIDIIEQVESSGTPVFSFAEQIELLKFEDEHGHEEEEGEEHSEEEGEHAHEGGDPHIWTDPTRMITAVEALGANLALMGIMDAAALDAQVQSYVAELTDLVAEMETTLAAVPEAQRVLVTNHEVFGYFADRFGFEVVGAVVPSLSTNAEPSTAEVEELVALIQAEQIPAIFADTSSPTQLAEVIAEEAGSDVAVVSLYSESLGEAGSGAESYIGMMLINAQLIAEALAAA
jgi:zinc/manganese transport system substrate-binding protein